MSYFNSHRADEPGPILESPEDAVAVARLSVSPGVRSAVMVLLCDEDHRLLLVLAVDGGTVRSVPSAIELVLHVAEVGQVAGIVVAVVRPRAGPVSAADAAALAGLVDRCDAAAVDLLDVLLISPRRWRSLWHLAEAPGEGEDGNQ